MENIDTQFRTPGQLIAALMDSRGWTNKLLASVLGFNETELGKVIQDKKSLSAELAVLLEEVFKEPADRFLELQKNYDLAKARIKNIPNPRRANQAELLGNLPISEMVSRGWITVENTKDVSQIENAIANFFSVNANDVVQLLPHAAKKTNVNEDVSPMQLAWLYRVKSIAEGMIVKPYTKQKADGLIKQLKPLLSSPQEARNVPKLLAECGIRLVFVEALKASKIDGVCFWLSEKKPVIGMSMRFDRMDNFWFVLRHELEHVFQGHGVETPMLDIELGSDLNSPVSVDDEEYIANNAASEFCAPKAKIDSFIARKAPLFPEKDFQGFAKLLGVHPCLIAGQIRHKTGRYELFNSHNVKIREYVIPSGIVDGWGDIYPVNL
jgi:HTH-type transcriptional regulator / antitoxin HigA